MASQAVKSRDDASNTQHDLRKERPETDDDSYKNSWKLSWLANNLHIKSDRTSSELSLDNHQQVTCNMQGWLKKCGQNIKSWKWRYFVLKVGKLTYFKDDSLKKIKGCMNIGISFHSQVTRQITEGPLCFLISSNSRNLLVCAPSENSLRKWINCFELEGASQSSHSNPTHPIIKLIVKNLDSLHEWKSFTDSSSSISMDGVLLKRGHTHKNWKQRFFFIDGTYLKYCASSSDREIRGMIDLSGYKVIRQVGKNFNGMNNYFVLASANGSELHLRAQTEEKMLDWIRAINEAKRDVNVLEVDSKKSVSSKKFYCRESNMELKETRIIYHSKKQFADNPIAFVQSGEAILVSQGVRGKISNGSQLICINEVFLPFKTYKEAISQIEWASFPMHLLLLEAPYKEGVLEKRNRGTFGNWKTRKIIMQHGQLSYYKIKLNKTETLKLKGVFLLAGCSVKLEKEPGRDHCIAIEKSPTNKLILQATSKENQQDWANSLHLAIRFATSGVTSEQISRSKLLSKLAEEYRVKI